MPNASRHSALRIAKGAFIAALAAAIAYALVREWGALASAAAAARPRWGMLALACALVLVNYALLVEAWRSVLQGWGARLRFWDGARIWSISNLARYIPGKVWQMGSMGVMAQAQGVSGVAAAGSALIVTLIHTVAGFVVLAATGANVLHVPVEGSIAIAALGAALLLAPNLLPWLGALASRLSRRSFTVPRLPHRAIWTAAAISALSWIVYGLAFRAMTAGVVGHATGAPGLYIAVFTGSYLAGFLALIVPGGVGVREVVMATALQRAGLGGGEALLIVVASRIWLTLLELIPALFFLARRRARRDRPHGTAETTL